MNPSARTFALAAAVLAAACAGPPPAPPSPPNPANRMRPDHAPTPFSAAELRAACGEGRWHRHRLETAGAAPLYRTTRFQGSTPEMARFAMVTQDAGGRPVGEVQAGEAPWEELQAHASFPTAATEIRAVTLATPMGELACWLYTVALTGEKGKEVNRFWFAREMPGPPVRLEREVAGSRILGMYMEATGLSGP